jgi:hypothetical protein
MLNLETNFLLYWEKSNIFNMRWTEGDDATLYINAKLYSTWKLTYIIEDYEIINNKSYDGIIKLNFNLDITNFNFKRNIKNIFT